MLCTQFDRLMLHTHVCSTGLQKSITCYIKISYECTYSILITFFSIICSYVNFHDKQNSLSIINGSVFNWCTLKCPICSSRSNTFIVNLEPFVLFYLHQLCCSEHRLAATLQHHTMTYYNSECLLVPSVGCYATHAVPCQGCQGL